MIPNIRTTLLNAASWANYDAAAVALALEGPFNDDYNQLNQCYQCHGAPDNKVYVNTRWPAVCFDVDNEAMYVKSDLRINNDVWVPSPEPGNDPVFDNLTHYWSMDEASGTRVDSKGAQNLTVSVATPSATGIAGNALDFRGLTTGSLTTGAWTLSEPFSIAYWFKPVGTLSIGQQRDIFQKSDSGDGLVDSFFTFDNPGPDYQSRFFVGGVGDNFSGVVVSLNSWHLVVVTVAAGGGANGNMYVDGVLNPDFGINLDPTTSDGALVVGNVARGAVDGLVDELMIFNVELTQANVTTLWNGGIGKFYRP